MIVSIPGVNLLVEVKDGEKPPSHRKLTDKEQNFHNRWLGPLVTVSTVEEAKAAVYMLFSNTGNVGVGEGVVH